MNNKPFVLNKIICSKKKVNQDEGNKKLLKDNRGIGVVEIILILVILIAIVLIFKSEIETIVRNAFNAITGNADVIIQ